MDAAIPVSERDELDAEARVTRKVFRRLMWFLLLLFICSYLDRINMSFGALSMNRALGLSATMFGIANSAFYFVYVFAEIPSNMMQARVGARLWIPRIMITWGIASAATMLAVGPHSLYALRAIVGLAEAGFMPGILLYITYWFPPGYRARASAWFIMAQPITIAFGSTVSGLILGMDGTLGLAGWRWLFLLEGLPAILFGLAALFYLDDRPGKARWLSAAEKRALARALERRQGEDRTLDAVPRRGVIGELLSLKVLLLAITYFGLVNTLSANSTWVPQIVRAVLPHDSLAYIGLVTAIPSLCTIALMPIWSAHSDRRRERTWHLVLPMALAALGWLIIIVSAAPLPKFVGLICCSVGTFSAQSVFWVLATAHLSAAARPVGIALINTLGLLGSTFGPFVIGYLRDRTHSFAAGLFFVVACLAVAILAVLALSRRRQRALLPVPG